MKKMGRFEMTAWWAKVYKIPERDLEEHFLDMATNDYIYATKWSDLDQAFVARVTKFRYLAAHGNTTREAYLELHSLVAQVLRSIYEEEV
jgi:predicted RNase H-like HicB family nuclease